MSEITLPQKVLVKLGELYEQNPHRFFPVRLVSWHMKNSSRVRETLESLHSQGKVERRIYPFDQELEYRYIPYLVRTKSVQDSQFR